MTSADSAERVVESVAVEDPAETGQSPYRYNARLANEIELAWQARWDKEGTFDSPNPIGPLAAGFSQVAGEPKFYVLDMFPYPSGAGLHVGHPLGYIGTDVFARYLRMTGHHVLHTFGYDAFGLPAEQYAIDTGQHPAVTTAHNIDNMRRQLKRLGLGHDTRREVSTTDVSFYRWTQWIFLQVFNSWADERTGGARPIADLVAEFESGQRAVPGGRAWNELSQTQQREVVNAHRLAYISEELVNWCPGLGTVLANEEVTTDGRSQIGNYPVYRRPLRQWMMRITAFAQRLIDDLDMVDWPESIKQMQRNWIGASDGALIDMPVAGQPGQSIRVFTTRPDTLYGATYAVLAPEHPQVDQLVPEDWPADTPQSWRYPEGRAGETTWTPRDAVAAYQRRAATLSDRQRAEDTTDKTGVFSGGYVVNPITAAPIPVFLADYVLTGYGTGAIMAVPAHDQRDLDFAHEFGLDIRQVLQPDTGWFEETGTDPQAPVTQWQTAFTGDGAYLAMPGPDLVGLTKQQGVEAAAQWLAGRGEGQQTRSYRLRDWLFSRQRYWGEPFPIVYGDDGLPIALPEDMLPVRLPEMTDFRPAPAGDDTSDPVPPLARVTDWANVELDLGAGVRTYRRELNTMPQWAGSCWYFLRYLDPGNEQVFVDPDVERYWMVPPDATEAGEGGVDLYVGGVEHAVLHLLYSRFWHKVLYDLGHVSTKEPFRRLYNQGYILADAFVDERGMYVPAAEVALSTDGTLCYQGKPVSRRAGKMGKSLKNSVNPDDIYQRYGADTLRLYEMAMGPLDADRPWHTDDIVGVYRFLQRLWRSIVDEDTGETRVSDAPLDEESLRKLHQTIMVVRRDVGLLRFNTAIARLMELTGQAVKVAARDGALPRALAEPLVLLVAPLAPHIAEELWSRLGHEGSLTYVQFPEADERLAAEETVEMPVQVNGKTRFRIEVPAAAGQGEVEDILAAHPDFARHTVGLTVQRVIVVPGRIVNVVTKP
ncbi:MAG TPA: class I tRNA ligase family protein [Streptosporangiaceae bacterium]|nr:class I tRNA ligase family protein [Streptosporangiaceae bacterium]